VVDTVSAESAEALVARLERELGAQYPDAQVVVSAFGQGPPTDAPIGFRLVGPDLELLTELGHAVRLAMHGVPAVISSRASLEAGAPKLWFDADEPAVVRTGLTLSDTARQLYSALEGVAAGTVFEDLTELPVHVRSHAPVRGSLEAIASLDLVTPVGRVPALSLGDFALRPEFAQITRRDGERINRIDGFVTSAALPLDAARAVRERFSANGLTLPPGYRLEVAGDSEGQAEAVAALTTYLPLIALLMAATVVMTFRSVTLAAVVGAVALMSVGFGMAALAVSGYPLGFNPLIGTAGLVGVAINGSIVVLANLGGDAGARAGDIDAIVRTVLGSGRHIVATTLTTVGGFGPLVVFVGGAFWPPLAIVIAGGVACSLVFSLIFTPCAFRLTVRRRAADDETRALSGLPT
jgi:multidrug efflux pump subunit AcrB